MFLMAALVPLVALAQGKPLPKGLEELGIALPVSLGMTAGDLDKTKGHVVRSGRFVAMTFGDTYQLSVKMDPDEKRVQQIVMTVGKDEYRRIVNTARTLYSEGNQYESEKRDDYESHVWKDKDTVMALIRNKGGQRLELSEREE
jgi:hypothetical protein